MYLTQGALGTIAALALLLSLVAVAVALANRRPAAAPAAVAPEKTEAPAQPATPVAKPVAPVAEQPTAAVPARLPEGISKITPAPADGELTAVIAAALAAYLDAEGGRTGEAVTHVTNVGSTGAPWSAAGRQAVIESRQTMYGKGYRR